MIAHLVFSVLTGLVFTAVAVLGFGAGLWMAALWYVIGSWAGFAASVVVLWRLLAADNPTPSDMRPEFG